MSNALFRVMKAATGSALSGLTGVVEGTDAVAGKVAALVSAFQDSSGDAAFPTLTALGAVPVSQPGVCLQSESGSIPELAGTSTLADISESEIVLTASKIHAGLRGYVSSMAESEFIIYQQDDATKTELMKIRTGPGQNTVSIDLPCFEITAGASGTQELRVESKNCDASQLSPMNAFLTINQAP